MKTRNIFLMLSLVVVSGLVSSCEMISNEEENKKYEGLFKDEPFSASTLRFEKFRIAKMISERDEQYKQQKLKEQQEKALKDKQQKLK